MLGKFITCNARLEQVRPCLARIVHDRAGEVMTRHISTRYSTFHQVRPIYANLGYLMLLQYMLGRVKSG
jgi:hypothetical protein